VRSARGGVAALGSVLLSGAQRRSAALGALGPRWYAVALGGAQRPRRRGGAR